MLCSWVLLALLARHAAALAFLSDDAPRDASGSLNVVPSKTRTNTHTYIYINKHNQPLTTLQICSLKCHIYPHLPTGKSCSVQQDASEAGRAPAWRILQRNQNHPAILTKLIQNHVQSILWGIYIYYTICNYIVKYILTIGAHNFYTLPCRFCWPIGGSIDISVWSVTSWVEFLRCLAEFLRPAASWMISANLTNNIQQQWETSSAIPGEQPKMARSPTKIGITWITTEPTLANPSPSSGRSEPMIFHESE